MILLPLFFFLFFKSSFFQRCAPHRPKQNNIVDVASTLMYSSSLLVLACWLALPAEIQTVNLKRKSVFRSFATLVKPGRKSVPRQTNPCPVHVSHTTARLREPPLGSKEHILCPVASSYWYPTHKAPSTK